MFNQEDQIWPIFYSIESEFEVKVRDFISYDTDIFITEKADDAVFNKIERPFSAISITRIKSKLNDLSI